jgi:2-polyprenyl-3-methyl-5-hydroxy-6-metoxy-1,4-benzoquinol methylase
MAEYKKNIYNGWGEKRQESFPHPNDEIVLRRMESYAFLIKRYLPKSRDANILDIGCGYGFFLDACHRAGYKNLTGVDGISQCVTFAKEQLNLRVVNDDILHYLSEIKDGTFDTVTAFDVIEHFSKQEVLEIFSLVYSKLKKDGLFIIQVPNAGSLSGLYVLYSDFTHEWGYTDILLRELFSLSGFDRLSVTNEYSSSNFLTKIIRSFLQKIFSKIFLINKHIFSSNLIAVGFKKIV